MFHQVPYQFVLVTFILELCLSGNSFPLAYIGTPVSWIPFSPLLYYSLVLVKSVF